MRMMFVILLALAVAASAAVAGIDPNADSFGVYFDEAGNVNTRMVGVFTPYAMYLLVANPTAAIDGFECVVTRVGSPSFVLSEDLGAGAVDADPAADTYRVQRATPYPVAAGVVMLVRWQWMQQSATPMVVFVGPTVPSSLPGGMPVVRNGGALRLGYVSSWSPSLPVACVNTYCVSAEEMTTFGAIKSLYR